MGGDGPTGLARELHAGLRAGGVTFAVYLPDSVLSGVEGLLEDDPDVVSVVCAREDEGVAVAAGAALAGRLPAALMEGSGVGYSGLILARAMSQGTPLVLVFSHTRARGSGHDYHVTSQMAGEGVCEGLGIPVAVVDGEATARRVAQEAAGAAASRRTVMAVAVPGDLRS